jgi:Protein of unknown function (DUF3617)
MLQRALVMTVSLFLAGTLGAADLKVKHGQWTASVEITGLPVALPPHTFTYCVDKDSAIPQEKQMKGCTINMHHKENTVNWTMSCDNGGKGTGTVTYQWDSMQAQVELTVPNSNMALTSKMAGKWTSPDCTKSTSE